MGRALTSGERALARGVFAAEVDLDAVRLHAGGFGAFAFTLGPNVFLPRPWARPDFAAADLEAHALLVHELVHVWQFQTRPFWTLKSWAGVMASGGYGPGLRGYRYTLPLGDFGALNLEQQASVVEHAFLLNAGRRSAGMPDRLSLSDLAASPFPARGEAKGPWG